VPHAGWTFSGRTAALTLKALATTAGLARVVIFGSDHWGIAGPAAIYNEGAWASPLGEVPIDEGLAWELTTDCKALRPDLRAHAREHSIEVQLPLMQVLAPDVRIVPISVAPGPEAAAIGRAVGQTLARLTGGKKGKPVAVVGSTDLTHYGPQYGFTPGGTGRDGLAWSRDNDRRLLKLIESVQAERIVPEAASRHNACGAGAIAATIAGGRRLGAARGVCLDYTTSADVMETVYQQRADDAVGYAAVVFA